MVMGSCLCFNMWIDPCHNFSLIQALATAICTIELMYALKHASIHCITWTKYWEDFGDLLCVCFWVHPFYPMCVDSFNVTYKLLEVKRHFRSLLPKPNTCEKNVLKRIWAGSSLITHLIGHREYDEELNTLRPSQFQRSDMSSFLRGRVSYVSPLHISLNLSLFWRILSSLYKMSLIWSAKERLIKKLPVFRISCSSYPKQYFGHSMVPFGS